MIRNLITILFFIFTQFVFSQEIIRTSIPSRQVTTHFSASEVRWAFPIDANHSVPLVWYERSSDFTIKEGIRTFVGYEGDSFVSTLVFSKGSISGHYQRRGVERTLETSADGFLIIKKATSQKEGGCGTCSGAACNSGHHRTGRPATLLSEGEDAVPLTSKVVSDGVLRVYRLAMPVSSEYFHGQFHSDVQEVKRFWAQGIVYLNEIYMRDIGVRFELVDDERLIMKDASTDPFKNKTPEHFTGFGTHYMNGFIGVQNYDVGIIVSTNTSRSTAGLASLGGAYLKEYKGSAISTSNFRTMAHEIGHLFGSKHTFTTGGHTTYYTETERGQSIMSYNFTDEVNFFSMVSIHYIRNWLSKARYYTDKERTQLSEGSEEVTNYPYGIRNPNTPPIINTSKLKKEYTIPQQTFFEFRIQAQDKEQQKLMYMAHPSDIAKQGHAKFDTYKQSSHNTIRFQSSHNKSNLSIKEFPDARGTYTFWLGVNDANLADNNHPLHYDSYQTQIHIKSGVPFKITSQVKKEYSAGEQVTLRWGVDANSFPQGSKVRILLSDDFGETFRHVLVAETENDGECEITIPHIELGKIVHYQVNGNPVFQSGKGLIKIEVIDHIAYALSDNSINRGGIEIKPSAITFDRTPRGLVNVRTKADALTLVQDEVTAISSCASNNQVTITYQQDATKNPIVRTWTATDACNNSAVVKQYVYYASETDVPLQFTTTPPADIELSCEESLPEIPTLAVSGGCNPQVRFTQNQLEEDEFRGCYKRYIRKWIVTDECDNVLSHTQTILITDKKAPVFQETLPTDQIIYEGDTMPHQETLTVKDNCRTGTIYVTREQHEETDTNGKVTKRIYTWEASDYCDNKVTHRQVITVLPKGTNPLQFTRTPENVSVACENVPTADNSQLSVSGCDEVTITHQDVKKAGACPNSYTLERTYTASGCGQSISHMQIITVTDTQAPTFSGTLPQDVSVEEDKIPSQADVIAVDNCGGMVQIVKKREEIVENGRKVVLHRWEASDSCGNRAEYVQKITILSKNTDEGNNSSSGGSNSSSGGGNSSSEGGNSSSEGGNSSNEGNNPPSEGNNPPSEGNNPSNEDIIIYNGVSTENTSENYLKIEPIDRYTDLHIEIFNELGQKVFQAKDYQRKGDVFRGYANVKGVVGKGKRLPSGTYFYVLKYKNQDKKMHQKSGYLYVR